MSNSGPSADEVAAIVRRKEWSRKLELNSPAEYSSYIMQRNKEHLAGAAGFIAWLLLMLLLALSEAQSWAIPVLFIGFVLIILFRLVAGELPSDLMLSDFESSWNKQEVQSKRKMIKMEKKINELAAKKVGNSIVLGAGAIYINQSTVTNSFNSLNKTAPELADALVSIAGFIEQKKAAGASEAYDNLAEAVNNKDKPSKIRAFWNELVKIVPDVAKLATAAAAITALFPSG